eukprot:15357767-Ditylum_brightwellii.AAC.1
MKQIYPGPIDRLVWMQQEAGGGDNHNATMSICSSPDKRQDGCNYLSQDHNCSEHSQRGDIKPTTRTLDYRRCNNQQGSKTTINNKHDLNSITGSINNKHCEN